MAKNRRNKIQPLPADIAPALRNYLTVKAKAASVWAGTWAKHKRGAKMLRRDLAAADNAYSGMPGTGQSNPTSTRSGIPT